MDRVPSIVFDRNCGCVECLGFTTSTISESTFERPKPHDKLKHKACLRRRSVAGSRADFPLWKTRYFRDHSQIQACIRTNRNLRGKPPGIGKEGSDDYDKHRADRGRVRMPSLRTPGNNGGQSTIGTVRPNVVVQLGGMSGMQYGGLGTPGRRRYAKLLI